MLVTAAVDRNLLSDAQIFTKDVHRMLEEQTLTIARCILQPTAPTLFGVRLTQHPRTHTHRDMLHIERLSMLGRVWRKCDGSIIHGVHSKGFSLASAQTMYNIQEKSGDP